MKNNLAPDQKKSGHTKTVLTIAAGVAALGATAYYFFGPQGTKNQKKLKGWMIKMKGEIIEKIETAEGMTEDMYNTIIDSISKKYKDIEPEELEAFVSTLKKHWKSIARLAQSKVKKSK